MSLITKLQKNSTISETAILQKSILFNEKDMITTQIPIINVALSGSLDGGFTPGITTWAGPSRHFKTLFSLVMVKSYLDKYADAAVLFYDTEFGTPVSYFDSLNIDMNRVVHTPIKNIEDLIHDIMNQLEKIERGDKVMIVIDSIGNIASKKEIDDAMEGKSVADMTRAKRIKSMFRMCTPHLTLKDIPMVVVNHTYATMELYSRQVVSGGCVVSGTDILMQDGSVLPVEKIQKGDYVSSVLGSGEVTHTWNPETLDEGEPECIEIEFEDGTKVVCSEKHSFVVGDSWVQAKDILPSMEVETIASINNSGIKPKPETHYAHSISNLFSKKTLRK